MRLEELTKILNEEAGISVCPICATPFTPRNSRQKTCGCPECKKKYHNQYVAENSRRKREENLEEARRYARETMRRHRHRKKNKGNAERRLNEAAEYWKDRDKINERITGEDYGRRSAEKTLAGVPKVDVNIREEKNDE